MAKLTWLGEQDYGEGETPLSACEWNGVLFTAGDKVEVSDEWMIAKARGNRFFKVEENGKDAPPAIMPETWTNDELPRRGGRPKRIRENDNGDQ